MREGLWDNTIIVFEGKEIKTYKTVQLICYVERHGDALRIRTTRVKENEKARETGVSGGIHETGDQTV